MICFLRGRRYFFLMLTPMPLTSPRYYFIINVLPIIVKVDSRRALIGACLNISSHVSVTIISPSLTMVEARQSILELRLAIKMPIYFGTRLFLKSSTRRHERAP